MQKLSLIILCTLFSFSSHADTQEITQCVMLQFAQGEESTTLKEVRALCAKTAEDAPTKEALSKKREREQEQAKEQEIAVQAPSEQEQKTPQVIGLGIISERVIDEYKTEFKPYVITPHRMNYILPAYMTTQINKSAYSGFDGYQDNLEDIETKFQLSLKVPLNKESLLMENDRLYLGFTMQAWWQVYADNISKPFRESNYQPEIFYLAPLDWHPFGGNTGFVLGFEHQSNGRGQLLSRSWNRFYGHFLFEKDNFALSIKPWHRLSEKQKQFELDTDGDDNPDIADYMGHFELGMVYKWQDMQLGFMGRQNFSTSRGAAELGLTFPLWGKLRGYATAFSGYGESLIDYNHNQTRFGVGISLNDIL